MTPDAKFTDRLRAWLDADPADRDIAAGALMLLQLSGNRIAYNNIMARPQVRAAFLEAELRRYLLFRLSQVTRREVADMQRQADKIVKDHIPLAAKAAEGRTGRRPDHDSLPDDIRQCYTDNLGILHRIRELHLKLRSLSTENATCPDSERYPFLKEMIKLDKLLHANWKRYDEYTTT